MKINTTQMTDYELCQLVYSGNHTAFSQICNRYLKSTTYYVRTLMRDSNIDFRAITDADIVQEVYIKLYFAIVNGTITISEGKNFGPVISVVARNLFIDKVRFYQKELNKQRQEAYPGEAENWNTANLQREIENKDFCRSLIAHAKARLNPKMYRVFEHVVYASPYSDIGADLGITPGATSSIVSRTRRVFLPLKNIAYDK